MVQAIIKIKEETNKVLNIVKAKHSLKDKSSAIDKMAEEYARNILEPSLRPEYVQKIKDIEKTGEFKEYNTIEELKKTQ